MFEELKTPYTILTARLLIGCWDPGDAAKMQEAVSESVASLLPFLAWAKGEPRDWHSKLAVMRRFRAGYDRGTGYAMGVFDKDRSAVVGGAGLDPRSSSGVAEIVYWVRKSRQNQGYATELTRALLKVTFELSATERVEIFCDPRNAASARVIEKAGFRKEGLRRHAVSDSEGRWQDLLAWAMLRDEYAASSIRHDSVTAFNEAGERIL